MRIFVISKSEYLYDEEETSAVKAFTDYDKADAFVEQQNKIAAHNEFYNIESVELYD